MFTGIFTINKKNNIILKDQKRGVNSMQKKREDYIGWDTYFMGVAN